MKECEIVFGVQRMLSCCSCFEAVLIYFDSKMNPTNEGLFESYSVILTGQFVVFV